MNMQIKMYKYILLYYLFYGNKTKTICKLFIINKNNDDKIITVQSNQNVYFRYVGDVRGNPNFK